MLFVPQERAGHVEWSEGSEPHGDAELSLKMMQGKCKMFVRLWGFLSHSLS